MQSISANAVNYLPSSKGSGGNTSCDYGVILSVHHTWRGVNAELASHRLSSSAGTQCVHVCPFTDSSFTKTSHSFLQNICKHMGGGGSFMWFQYFQAECKCYIARKGIFFAAEDHQSWSVAQKWHHHHHSLKALRIVQQEHTSWRQGGDWIRCLCLQHPAFKTSKTIISPSETVSGRFIKQLYKYITQWKLLQSNNICILSFFVSEIWPFLISTRTQFINTEAVRRSQGALISLYYK